MPEWTTTRTTWINLSSDADLWVRVDQIEAVYRSEGRVVVRLISGTKYLASGDMTIKRVLDLMTGKN